MKERLMIVVFIVMALFFVSFDADSAVIENPIYRQIVQNRSDINPSYALELSRLIMKHAETYDVPAEYLAAILSVESDYRLYVVNGASKDYGISQINEYNVKAYKMDRQRLVTDLDYSVEAGAKILGYFHNRYKRDGIERVIGAYNCGTAPKCIESRRVQRYIRNVKSRL